MKSPVEEVANMPLGKLLHTDYIGGKRIRVYEFKP